MPPNIDAVSFDCYGTLIDAHGGLAAFLYLLARGCGEDHPPPGSELAASFLKLQAGVMREGFRGFEELLATTLRALAAERRWRLDRGDFESLAQCMSSWQPYPGAPLVLRSIKASGLEVGLIANCSHRIMSHTLRQLDVSVDAVLVSDDHRAYKSAPALCERIVSELSTSPERVLHVSAEELRAAHAVGCRTAWLNTTAAGRPPKGPKPDYQLLSLRGLLDLVAVTLA